jgi:CheY-like chemotaxis protein
MRNKFILLVDDDSIANFIHQKLIQRSALADRVETLLNGKAALDYLNGLNVEAEFPSLILLDINMPVMDGWEFLDEFEKNKKLNTLPTKIVILTTSLNLDDKMKAEKHQLVTAFKNKPLTEETIEALLKEQ